MNGVIHCLIIFIIARFSNIKVFASLLHYLALTVRDLNLSHTGRVEGGTVSVKQEHEEMTVGDLNLSHTGRVVGGTVSVKQEHEEVTGGDLNLSHTGRVEGGTVSVKQEHEVKWCCFL